MAKLRAIITGDARPLIREVKKAERSLGKLEKTGKASADGLSKAFSGVGSVFTSVAKASAVAAAALTGAFAAASAKSISLAREQIRVEKQLDAVLRSTGNAAGISAEELKANASALQEITNFGDEATISAQSLLLTFTNIGRQTFPAATKVTLDLATAMNTDLKSAALQVGKALNDPIKGLSSLSEAGIQFTEQQKEQVKALVESGEAMKAQGIILEELQKQFGGSAEAAADPFIQLGNIIGDIGEEFGRFQIKFLNPLSEAFKGLLGDVPSDLSELSRLVGDVTTTSANAVKEFAAEVKASGGAVRVTLDAIASGFETLSDGLAFLSAPVAGIVTGFSLLVDTLKAGALALGAAVAGVTSLELGLAAFVTGTLKGAADGLADFFKGINDLPFVARLALGPLGAAAGAAEDAFRSVGSTLGEIEGAAQGAADAAGDAFTKLGGDLTRVQREGFNLTETFDSVKGALNGASAEATSASETLTDLSGALGKAKDEASTAEAKQLALNKALNEQDAAARKAAFSVEALADEQESAAASAVDVAAKLAQGNAVLQAGFNLQGQFADSVNGAVIQGGSLQASSGVLQGGFQTGGVVARSGVASVERGEGVLTRDGLGRLTSLLLDNLNRPSVSFGDVSFGSGGSASARDEARRFFPEFERIVSRGVRASLA